MGKSQLQRILFILNCQELLSRFHLKSLWNWWNHCAKLLVEWHEWHHGLALSVFTEYCSLTVGLFWRQLLSRCSFQARKPRIFTETQDACELQAFQVEQLGPSARLGFSSSFPQRPGQRLRDASHQLPSPAKRSQPTGVKGLENREGLGIWNAWEPCETQELLARDLAL